MTIPLKLLLEIGEYLSEMMRARESCVEEEVRIAIRSAYAQFLKEKLDVAEHALLLETADCKIRIPCGTRDIDDDIPF